MCRGVINIMRNSLNKYKHHCLESPNREEHNCAICLAATQGYGQKIPTCCQEQKCRTQECQCNQEQSK